MTSYKFGFNSIIGAGGVLKKKGREVYSEVEVVHNGWDYKTDREGN